MDAEIKKAVEKLDRLASDCATVDWFDHDRFEREAEKVLRELLAKAEGLSRAETMKKWRLAGALDLKDY